MEVILKYQECNEMGEGEYYSVETPESTISVGDMEPEDANLSRDLNCIFKIEQMLQEAYDAGKNGEELIFTHRDIDE